MSAAGHKRLRVAMALNRLPGTCWTNLVRWALYRSPLREGFTTTRCFDTGWCEGQLCYCGKRGADCPESIASPEEVTQ